MENLAFAGRWSAEPDEFGFGAGLHDGIQVAIEPGLAAGLQATTPEDLVLLHDTVEAAFAAWGRSLRGARAGSPRRAPSTRVRRRRARASTPSPSARCAPSRPRTAASASSRLAEA